MRVGVSGRFYCCLPTALAGAQDSFRLAGVMDAMWLEAAQRYFGGTVTIGKDLDEV